MSRKTVRNAAKSAFKRRVGLKALGGTAYANIGISGLALGSLTLGVGGVAHAQNTPARKSADPAAMPAKAAKAKRSGFKATPMGPHGVLARNGAGLYAQNAAQPAPIITAGNTRGQSSATALAPIVVTGIRGSLLRSLAIKRESIGVVDAISAETIGQFPDSSVGGALAHLPGVTVNRGYLSSTAEGATTATGLAQGVNVNGFGGSFDTVLVNGRQIASGNGQAFNFSGIGAMYVGQIDVLKTPDMALSSGNIGSVINVKMLTPFDNPGMHVGVNVGATDYAMDGAMRPAVGALFSDTFDHDKFGILVDGDYTDYHTLLHHQDIVGWKGDAAGSFACSDLAANYTTTFGSTGCASVGPGASGDANVPVWYPQEMNMWLERVDTRSKDGRVVVQWHPTKSVMVTVDDDYSSWNQSNTEWGRSTWFGGFNNAELDPNGTISDFTYTGPTDLLGNDNDQYIVTNTYGLNVLWNVNEDWTLEVDADQSKSQFNPNGAYNGVGADVGFGDAGNNYTGGLVLNENSNVLPYWSAYGPNAVATGSGAVASANYNGLNPLIIGSHDFPLQTQQNTDQINEATIRATWNPGTSTKVSFGAQFLDDDWNTKEFDTFTNNYWELWAGYGPPSGNTQGVALPPSLFSAVNLGNNWMPGFSGGGNLPASMVMYNPYSLLSYLETQPVDSQWSPTSGYPRYTGGVPAEALSTGSVQHVSRMNYAPFVQVSRNFRVEGMKLMTRLGLRYQRTDEVIAGLAAPLQSVTWEGASDPTAYVFAYGKPTWTQTTRSYGNFLPALDLALWPTHDLETAFDFSRTESAPPNSQLIPNTSYGGRVNALTATGNNPGLLPYLSNNYDFRVTWFYKHGDYAEIHPFYKQVSDFPTSSVSDVTLPINDPAPCSYSSGGTVVFTDSNCGKPMVFAETTYTNKLSTDVTGVAATWQQMLPYGFGVMINGTWMHTNSNFNNYDLSANQFALPGVGSSANGTLFYQRGKWQARVTVNWQAKLLLFLGQEQGGGAFGNEPVYQAPYTQLDYSMNYQVDKYLNVYFTASNLLNSVYHTYGRFPNQTLNLVEYGRSLSFGVRAKF
jgi:iron complex outermembrane receptor protein